MFIYFFCFLMDLKIELIALQVFQWNHPTFSKPWRCPKLLFTATLKNTTTKMFRYSTPISTFNPVQMTWSTPLSWHRFGSTIFRTLWRGGGSTHAGEWWTSLFESSFEWNTSFRRFCFFCGWSYKWDEENNFLTFHACFWIPIWFFPIWIIIVLIHYIRETFRNKVKKHSVTRNCSDLSLFEQIVLVISKCLQIQPWISKKKNLNH